LPFETKLETKDISKLCGRADVLMTLQKKLKFPNQSLIHWL